MKRKIGFWQWFGSSLLSGMSLIWTEFFGDKVSQIDKVKNVGGFVMWGGASTFILGIGFQSFWSIVGGPMAFTGGLGLVVATWIYNAYLESVK